jgi:hypothetical protein
MVSMPMLRALLRCGGLGLACLSGVAGAQALPGDPGCPIPRDARTLAYDNPRWGVVMVYPAGFALDPGSVTENGDSARFWTADRQATAVVTAFRNRAGQSLAELRQEAELDILENSRGSITYRRTAPGWFVLSGYVGERIYYRRTFLTRGGGVIATLWVEFPRGMRPCFEEAVTTMSLSFRGSP